MFIAKTNKVRHLLLGVLIKNDTGTMPVDLQAGSIHFDQICEQLPKYDRSFLLDNLDFLQTSKLIYCSMEFDKSKFHILSNGSHAYNERKFLREGVKDQMNYLYDIVKNISVIVLLIIGVWSFVLNLAQTRRNTRMLEKQQAEIKALKDSLMSGNGGATLNVQKNKTLP